MKTISPAQRVTLRLLLVGRKIRRLITACETAHGEDLRHQRHLLETARREWYVLNREVTSGRAAAAA